MEPQSRAPYLLCAGHVIHSHKHVVQFSSVSQSCPTLCDPMNCSLSDFSVHGIFQARVLEWIAVAFSHSKMLGGAKLHIETNLIPARDVQRAQTDPRTQRLHRD